MLNDYTSIVDLLSGLLVLVFLITLKGYFIEPYLGHGFYPLLWIIQQDRDDTNQAYPSQWCPSNGSTIHNRCQYRSVFLKIL